MDDRITKRIVIINGKGASGKDTFVDMVKEYVNTENYSSIDLIKKVAKQLGYDGGKTMEDRKFLSDMKLLATEYNDAPYNDIINRILKFLYCKDNKNNLLFLHVREPKEIQRLLEFGKENNLEISTLLIVRDLLKKETYGNMADDNVDNFIYDYYVFNNGTKEDLYGKMLEYLSDFHKFPIFGWEQ